MDPSGSGTKTLVLVMTDLEGSTRLWAEHSSAMPDVMGLHHAIVHAAVEQHRGWRPVDQGEGDAVFAAFKSATAAVAAVVAFQSRLAGQEWPPGIRVRVRVGIHAGEVLLRGGNLFGTTVNRAARLRGLAAGGQVLLSAPVHELVRDHLVHLDPPSSGSGALALRDLGSHRLKDLQRPEHVHQLLVPGLQTEFPELAGLDRAAHNLPVAASSFIGRERELSDVVSLLGEHRLVTVTGFGGLGKTRLALQVAGELADSSPDGVWFVDCSTATDPAAVPSLVAAVLGVEEDARGALPPLVRWLSGKRLLLVLDNLEQLLPGAASAVEALVRSGGGVAVLATSREPLRVDGEQEYALAPLPAPPPADPVRGTPAWSDDDLVSLSTYGSVELFVARAAAVRRGFTLTPANAAAIAAICARLDGLPLALELAAARTRSLSPEALLPRLEDALRVLTGGARTAPARHQTLRATITWSYDALGPDGQRLLDTLSVFPGSFTLEAAEAVAGPALEPEEDDLDVLDGLDSLVERSLLLLLEPDDDSGADRYRLLVPIRDFGAERLEDRGRSDDVAARHASHFRHLLPPMREWTPDLVMVHEERAQAEVHNLRAAFARSLATGPSGGLLELAETLCFALDPPGLVHEQLEVTTAALAVEGPPTAQRAAISRMRANALLNAGRAGAARTAVRQAQRAALAAGDPSLVAITSLFTASSATRRLEALALLEVAERHAAEVPSADTHLPRWMVQRLWKYGMAQMGFVVPDAVEAAQLELLHEPVEFVQQIAHQQLGRLHLAHSRFSEAEEHLRRFEDPLADVDDEWLAAEGAADAALLRLEKGYLDQAAAALDVADQRSAGLCAPGFLVSLAVRRAALLRATGDGDEAVEVLRRALHEHAAQVEGAHLAAALWLDAVLRREAGDDTTAASSLQRAWTEVAGNEVEDPAIVLLCLLERATQVLGEDPAGTVRLISLVDEHRGDLALLYGVRYDRTALVEAARVALGDDEVTTVLTEVHGHPLPEAHDWR